MVRSMMLAWPIEKMTRSIPAIALLIPLWVAAQGDPQADARRFAEIKARHDAGQQVSREEQQFAMRYMAAAKTESKSTSHSRAG